MRILMFMCESKTLFAFKGPVIFTVYFHIYETFNPLSIQQTPEATQYPNI